MLTLFPDLLTYSFFGPTIVRLALGVALLSIAHRHFLGRNHAEGELRHPFGALAPTIALGLPIIETAAGILIVAGLFTQIAALLTLLISVKLWLMPKRYPAIASPGALTLLLMGAVALLLIVTGPGAFAFDLPL